MTTDEKTPGTSDLVGARRKLLMRLILFVFLVSATAWFLSQSDKRARFWHWLGISEVVNAGDVRAARASGKTALDVPPGAQARVENLLVTHPAAGKTNNYFYCPIYGILVRTPRSLPEPSGRLTDTEIPAGLEYLLQQRKVLPEDFSQRFDAEGWLLPLREAPGFRGGIEEYVRNTLKLSDAEFDVSWALLDGEIGRASCRERV